jgi:hypothetical protein
MIYSVRKRGGVWTVATDEVLLSFESYGSAVDAAQGAAEVLRRSARDTNAPEPYMKFRLCSDNSSQPAKARFLAGAVATSAQGKTVCASFYTAPVGAFSLPRHE